MSAPEDNLEAAERIVSILAGQGVTAIVIGAIALAAHGYVRHTEDIDLGVEATPSQMRSLVQCLAEHGFEVEFHEPDSSDPLCGVLDVSGSFGLVQIISFADRFPAAIRDALMAEDVRIRPGSPLRVIPIPQLVALKFYSGGSRAKADIVELLRRNPDLDLDEIRRTCQRYRIRGFDAVLAELE